MATYIIDIDGVIRTKGHGGKYTLAQPIQKNIDIVNHLKRLGNKIIPYTTRIEAVINTVNNYNEAMSLYGKEEDVTDA